MAPRYRASLSQSQGREGWSVIFRHPLKTDTATGKPGRRVRKGLGTSDDAEAQSLVNELNELLSDQALWSVSARSTAEPKYDQRVVKIFYDDLVPENWDFFAVRDTEIHLPDSATSDYRRVMLVGTTGSGKTTLVRQLIGTDPKRERFPSTSTARTTVADTEILLDDGPFRAVVTFMPLDQVRDYVEECLTSAVLEAHHGGSDDEIRRRLLHHVDQRFRLSYILGTGTSIDDFDDLDADELPFDHAVEDDSPVDTFDMSPTLTILSDAVKNARILAARHASRLREDLKASQDDEQVIEEIFEDNLEHILREDEDYFGIADSLVDEIDRRFSLLSSGETLRTTQGWPKLWRYETADRNEFIQVVSRFTSNYAPLFGTLLTPIVNGIRVAGPFSPNWADQQPHLILLDGEGLGHTPDSASSLPTTVTGQFERVDAILLVDSSTQPMQAASYAVMRGVAAVGHTAKLIFCYTHFDQVTGDNLRTFTEKEHHVLASAENALRNIGEQMGPWAERSLRQRVEHASFFLGGIDLPLDLAKTRGLRTVHQLQRLLTTLEQTGQDGVAPFGVAVYDKTDLVLAVQKAAESFHEGWRARLGRDVRPGIAKEHWTRVKALSRRLAMGAADEYDNLRPVADLHLLLQQELYKAIQSPRKWKGRTPSDDEKQALFDQLLNKVSGEVMRISTVRLRYEPISRWQEAYAQSGTGSSFVRASIIADRIYGPAAPATTTAAIPDRNVLLKEVLEVVERVAAEFSAELR